MTDSIEREIEEMAVGHLHLSPDELESTFYDQIIAVRGEGIPNRGSSADYWLRVRDRIVREMIKNRVAVSVMTGHATAQVVAYFKAIGVDLDAYKITISFFVALVVKAALDELAENYPPED